jgi:hypothetical protein
MKRKHFARAAMAGAAAGMALAAAPVRAAQVQTVFVISMENHNWTQPNGFVGPATPNLGAGSGIQQIKNNTNAPFENALINGTASAVINGSSVNISQQTAYANNYYNVLATPSGNNPSIHPSEPNYIWSEAGTNYGVLNDNQPYQSPGGTVQGTPAHLAGLMSQSGVSWTSYQEDTQLAKDGSNKLTSTVLSPSQYTVPTANVSGTNAAYTNPYNGSHQYDYAAKHNPQVIFADTTGNNIAPAGSALTQHYAPMQQLSNDLNNNTVAQYNWITPDQFNDAHTGLSGGYTSGGTQYTGDSANIKQGDDFLKTIVPQIMGSTAYQNNGAIVIWWDESESQGAGDTTQNDQSHTLEEIVISPLAHANVGGLPYSSNVTMTHSSDLKTMEEIFNLGVQPYVQYGGPTAGNIAGPFLGDANNANDLSDLFAAGAIPDASSVTNLVAVPEPASLSVIGLGAIGLLGRRARSRSK